MDGHHNDIVMVEHTTHQNANGEGLLTVVTEYRADGCITWRNA